MFSLNYKQPVRERERESMCVCVCVCVCVRARAHARNLHQQWDTNASVHKSEGTFYIVMNQNN
jgi:hypothetical protein